MGKAQNKPEKPVVHFESREEFSGWLAENFEDEVGIWLKLAKKSGQVPAPNYDEAVEVALCFGWIDGQVRRFDEHVYLQSFTPRRKRSPWSKRNVGLASELIESGRMEPRGFAEVERARRRVREVSASRTGFTRFSGAGPLRLLAPMGYAKSPVFKCPPRASAPSGRRRRQQPSRPRQGGDNRPWPGRGCAAGPARVRTPWRREPAGS